MSTRSSSAASVAPSAASRSDSAIKTVCERIHEWFAANPSSQMVPQSEKSLYRLVAATASPKISKKTFQAGLKYMSEQSQAITCVHSLEGVKFKYLDQRHRDYRKKFEHLDNMQCHIAEIIRKRGPAGIFESKLKFEVDLYRKGRLFKKYMRSLLRRGIVRIQRRITDPQKVCYVSTLTSISTEHFSGSWYDETKGVYRSSEMDVFATVIMKKLDKGKSTTAEKLSEMLKRQKTPNDKIFEFNVDASSALQILKLMYFDGKIEPKSPCHPDTFDNETGFVRSTVCCESSMSTVPCAVCPVYEKCDPAGGPISPQTCQYIRAWLSACGAEAW